jgi:FxsC-like protein
LCVRSDLDSAENVFQTRPRWDGDDDRPQRVHFVVAAGTRQQMLQIRKDVQFYGERREDWAPFCPTTSQPIADHARTVAADRLLGSEVVSIDAVEEHLAAARDRNEIVVLLVDAWATRLEALRQALHEVARRHDAEFAVLVPANQEDSETVTHHGELKTAMLRTFSGPAGRRTATLNLEIESVDGFDKDLVRVLTDARHRIYRTGRVFRRPATPGSRARPILNGP